jgi:tRNA(Ile)-lysidine synthetase-like protein
MARSDIGNIEALTSIALSELAVNMSSRILCATSGGGDSVTMAHVLAKLRQRGQFAELGMIHINHLLRGDESDNDERLIRELESAIGTPAHIFRIDTKERAKREGMGIEEAAREDRYEKFVEVSQEYKYDFVITAHTTNDNLETVIINMIRGAGIQGLRGIPPKRELSDVTDIIRPWLDIERADIRKYALENGIRYHEDSSNLSHEFLRNRIRHTVVSALEESFKDRNIYDGFRQTIKNISEQTKQLEDSVRILSDICQEKLPEGYVRRDAYCCADFALISHDDTFRREFISEVLQKYLREPVRLSLDSVQTMIVNGFVYDSSKKELQLTPEIVLSRVETKRRHHDEGRDLFGSSSDEDDDDDDEYLFGGFSENDESQVSKEGQYEGEEGANFDLNDYNFIIEKLHPYAKDWQEILSTGNPVETHIGTLSARIISGAEVEFVSGNAYFDASILGSNSLLVRPWREGDRIVPFGMGGHSKLVSDILNEAGVSAYNKTMCVVVISSNEPDKILWVPGLRAADVARVTGKTETVLTLERTMS